MTSHSYAPQSGATFEIGSTTRDTCLRRATLCTRRAGEYSGGEAGHIHRFYAVSQSELLTIVLTGQPLVFHSEVFLPRGVRPVGEVRPTPLGADQIDYVVGLAKNSIRQP